MAVILVPESNEPQVHELLSKIGWRKISTTNILYYGQPCSEYVMADVTIEKKLKE